eukprot:g17273.t1
MRKVPQEEFERGVLAAHDRAFEEQRFLPKIWDAMGALNITGKARKRALDSIDEGRKVALKHLRDPSSPDEVKAFVSRWVDSALLRLSKSTQGDPESVLDLQQAVELFTMLQAKFFELGCVKDSSCKEEQKNAKRKRFRLTLAGRISPALHAAPSFSRPNPTKRLQGGATEVQPQVPGEAGFRSLTLELRPSRRHTSFGVAAVLRAEEDQQEVHRFCLCAMETLGHEHQNPVPEWVAGMVGSLSATLMALVIVINAVAAKPKDSGERDHYRTGMLLSFFGGQLSASVIASYFLWFVLTLSVMVPFFWFSEPEQPRAIKAGGNITASINFCEGPDFHHSDVLAEPVNVATSMLFYMPVGLIGLLGPAWKEGKAKSSPFY